MAEKDVNGQKIIASCSKKMRNKGKEREGSSRDEKAEEEGRD